MTPERAGEAEVKKHADDEDDIPEITEEERGWGPCAHTEEERKKLTDEYLIAGSHLPGFAWIDVAEARELAHNLLVAARESEDIEAGRDVD